MGSLRHFSDRGLGPWLCHSGVSRNFKDQSFCLRNANEVIPIADVEGHVIAAGIRRGLAFFENGDVATYTNWGTADLIKGRGSNNGYTMFTFEDGSTIFYAVKGIYEPGPKGFGVGKGMGEFTRGTGKYEGITGSLTWSSKFYTNYSKEKGTFGDFSLEITATYTLPQK